MENIFNTKEFQEDIMEQMTRLQKMQKTAYDEGYKAGYRAKMEEVCKYSGEDKSERCAKCHSALCTFCGYEKEGLRLCNECYASKKDESPRNSTEKPLQEVLDHDHKDEKCGTCPQVGVEIMERE